MNSFKTALLASLPLLFDPAAGRAETTMPQSERAESTQRRHLSATSTVGDILHHPAFSGYARRLLPWDDRRYDESMELSAIGGLLPYHSAVDTGTVLGGLNRIIDDVAAGRQVFYNMYSAADRRDDPTKENTGLFFFRGRPGAPFAIVSPGGGFAYVGSVHEGFPYAVEINQQGYNFAPRRNSQYPPLSTSIFQDPESPPHRADDRLSRVSLHMVNAYWQSLDFLQATMSDGEHLSALAPRPKWVSREMADLSIFSTGHRIIELTKKSPSLTN